MILVDIYEEPSVLFKFCAAISELSYVFLISLFWKMSDIIFELVRRDNSFFKAAPEQQELFYFM